MIHFINCKGRLLDFSEPRVMGILNVTPDSFFDGGKYVLVEQAVEHAARMLAEGATIIDVGGMSSRPGAALISVEEEINRVVPVIAAIQSALPEAIIAVDTWRSEVAQQAVAAGASIINDISAGTLDDKMFPIMAELNVPVVLMHMKGTPATMQLSPLYEDVVTETLDFLMARVSLLQGMGVNDIIVDPGFGFGKTILHNYELLRRMRELSTVLQCPLLAGLSRKSMIYKVLGTEPASAINGTSVLNMVALDQGAQILRVHDVKEAIEVIQLWKMLHSAG
jgi:dihydropteroate synthase